MTGYETCIGIEQGNTIRPICGDNTPGKKCITIGAFNMKITCVGCLSAYALHDKEIQAHG